MCSAIFLGAVRDSLPELSDKALASLNPTGNLFLEEDLKAPSGEAQATAIKQFTGKNSGGGATPDSSYDKGLTQLRGVDRSECSRTDAERRRKCGAAVVSLALLSCLRD